MKLPIKPKFLDRNWDRFHQLAFNEWYDKVFAGAVEVEAVVLGESNWYASSYGCLPKTHTALLINIEPIKQDTAEDLVKAMVDEYDQSQTRWSIPQSMVEKLLRAKLYLEKK